MNILFIITRSDTVGGAHIHVADISEWLINKGHSVTIVVGGHGPYCDLLYRKGIPYISCAHLKRSINPIIDLLALIELRRLIRRLSPDLVSLHSSKAGLIGRMASIKLGIPVLFTAHGWSFTDGIDRLYAAIYRSLERFSAPLANRIIAVSDYDKTLAIKAKITSPDKIVTIHNAMPDSNRIADPGNASMPTRIIMVARLDNQKDHKLLLNALASLKTLDWSLDLVGDGPNETKLKSEISKLGLESRINFLGLRKDVDALLEKSHIFVLTSHWEGFPRSILEAMRAGLPVIASSVGGVPESVKEDLTGYLIPRNDIDTLTDRLSYLINAPDERRRLGLAARQLYENNYRFNRMAVETLAIYNELVNEKPCVSV